MVRRERGVDDRREVLVRLTAKGTRLLKQLSVQRKEQLRACDNVPFEVAVANRGG